MSTQEWGVLSEALRILSPALGGWAIFLLRQILGQLRTLNGRVTKIEVWQANHDAQDKERFESIHREIDQLRILRSYEGGHA